MNSLQFEFVKPFGRTFFSPGDQVAGNCRVELNDNIARQTARIDVVLSGRTEIRLFEKQLNNNIRAPYPGNRVSQLFEDRQTIVYYQPGQSPPFGRYMYPFRFVMPAHPAFGMVAGEKHEAADRPHLPPSMTHCGLAQKWSGMTRAIYQVEAQIYNVQGHCLRREASEIVFAPVGWYEAPKAGFYPVTRHLEVESHYLDKDYAETDGLKRAMKRMALRKSPVAHMDILLQMPTHASVGQAFPLAIGVEHDLERSTTLELPAVWLTEFSVKMRENMLIGQGEANALITQEANPYIEFKPDIKENPIRISERADLRSAGGLTLQHSSFISPPLRRYFDDISVQATIVCAQRTFHLEFKGTQELHIHPFNPQAPQEIFSNAKHNYPQVPELMGAGTAVPKAELAGSEKFEAPQAPVAELPFNMPPGGIPGRYGSQPMAELP